MLKKEKNSKISSQISFTSLFTEAPITNKVHLLRFGWRCHFFCALSICTEMSSGNNAKLIFLHRTLHRSSRVSRHNLWHFRILGSQRNRIRRVCNQIYFISFIHNYHMDGWLMDSAYTLAFAFLRNMNLKMIHFQPPWMSLLHEWQMGIAQCEHHSFAVHK